MGHQNISWKRVVYTFTSTQGTLILFFASLYALVGFACLTPRQDVPAVLYVFSMIVVWLATESAGQMTRLSRLALTVSFVLIMLATVYCSIFIWKDDVEILIYPLTPITKYQIW